VLVVGKKADDKQGLGYRSSSFRSEKGGLWPLAAFPILMSCGGVSNISAHQAEVRGSSPRRRSKKVKVK